MLKFSILYIHGLKFIDTVGIEHDLCSKRNTSNSNFLFFSLRFSCFKINALYWASRTSSCVVFLLLFFFKMIFFFRCIDHFIIDFVGVAFILLHSFLEFFKQVFIHLNCFQLSSYCPFWALKKHPHILRWKKVTSCLKLLVISSKVQSKSWPKWLI